MPILIRHDRFDDRLDKLVERQPARVSRTALLEAMIESSIDACERTGNPEAWREIGNGAAQVAQPQAQQNAGPGNFDPVTQPATGPNGRRDMKPAPTGKPDRSA